MKFEGCAARCCGHRSNRYRNTLRYQAREPLPPATRRFAVRRDGRNNQRVARPGQRHIERIEFFAFALCALVVKVLHCAGRRPAFTGHEDKFLRPPGMAWPVDQHPHSLGSTLGSIRVEQQHRPRFQTLGAVDGQQTYCRIVDRRRRQHTTGFQGAHERIRRGIPPATNLQCGREQGAQIRQHRVALRSRRRDGKTRQHVAIAIDGLQRIVGRQLVQPGFPPQQRAAHGV